MAYSQTRDESTSSLSDIEPPAIDFVRKHHPELADLLGVLKSMKPNEYEAAIREISKARRRLDILEKRDRPLYEVDVENWKLQSKIDLLVARAVAREKDLDSETLRMLVRQRVENQKKRLLVEQKNLIEREKQIQESLSRIDGHEQERTEQQMTALLKKVDSSNNKKKKKP